MRSLLKEVKRMQKLAGILTEAVEVPSWLKGKLEDVHTKPGQGSIFSKSIDDVLKLVQDALDKEDDIDKIANSTGTVTVKSPGIGYNLVLPIEKAKKLPGAKEGEVEKAEGPNKVTVPSVTTTAPLSQFTSDELTVIVRPKKDEKGTVIPNEYIVLSAFPGDPTIPRASEWGGKYAVVIPSGKQELKENQQGKEMTFNLSNELHSFPSPVIDDVEIEDGVVTRFNSDIEGDSIYSFPESDFAAVFKPFKDAGVKVSYTPWTSSGGDDYEGYYTIDYRSLNDAIENGKITIKVDPNNPEELVLAESKMEEDIESIVNEALSKYRSKK